MLRVPVVLVLFTIVVMVAIGSIFASAPMPATRPIDQVCVQAMASGQDDILCYRADHQPFGLTIDTVAIPLFSVYAGKTLAKDRRGHVIADGLTISQLFPIMEHNAELQKLPIRHRVIKFAVVTSSHGCIHVDGPIVGQPVSQGDDIGDLHRRADLHASYRRENLIDIVRQHLDRTP